MASITNGTDRLNVLRDVESKLRDTLRVFDSVLGTEHRNSQEYVRLENVENSVLRALEMTRNVLELENRLCERYGYK